MASRDALKISEKDSVAVALRPLKKGDSVALGSSVLRLVDDIPMYHKFALADIRRGEKVIKYGESIGEASENISAGGYVHIHNVKSLRG
ncbi:MAG: UxaA family hydrolase [Synergistaceae bacterium]|jgi:altronate dehydratase|uniref:UxaA family hydrolase n=1 Tax=Aminivibrio sp. TaxID=1872489 RepID=UPI001D514E0C|nr:UxaA family hydrolase [Synergistaceae bacterium]MDD2779680.1 UxaA family hydrolase [Candidatus Methanomethylophilaceae archaeon]NCC56144.1 altronate hydrolase [Synergistales bacterium]MDD3689470.1 UxaA family hydrolase [Synergistaceae bacterium]MDD4020949.1 UxaA family hydrolase [Synergistaceae bacterium]